MKAAQWYVLAILSALVVVPALSAAASNRILNGDCEEAGDDVFAIPHWKNDWDAGRNTARVSRLGPDNSAACALIGNGMLRSAALFPVTNGEVFEVSADIWEMHDDNDEHSGLAGQPAGDSVLVLEFVYVSGYATSISFHCDQYVDYLDNGANDGSDECSVSDQYIHFETQKVTCKIPVTANCRKYQDPVVVPASAVYGRVVIANGIHTQNLEPFVLRNKLASPSELTLFDNIVVRG